MTAIATHALFDTSTPPMSTTTGAPLPQIWENQHVEIGRVVGFLYLLVGLFPATWPMAYN